MSPDPSRFSINAVLVVNGPLSPKFVNLIKEFIETMGMRLDIMPVSRFLIKQGIEVARREARDVLFVVEPSNELAGTLAYHILLPDGTVEGAIDAPVMEGVEKVAARISAAREIQKRSQFPPRQPDFPPSYRGPPHTQSRDISRPPPHSDLVRVDIPPPRDLDASRAFREREPLGVRVRDPRGDGMDGRPAPFPRPFPSRDDRPPLRDDRPRVRDGPPIREGPMIRDDRPPMRDGPPIREGPMIRDDRPLIRDDRPMLRDDRPFMRNDRPLAPPIREDRAPVREDRPPLRDDRPPIRDDRGPYGRSDKPPGSMYPEASRDFAVGRDTYPPPMDRRPEGPYRPPAMAASSYPPAPEPSPSTYRNWPPPAVGSERYPTPATTDRYPPAIGSERFASAAQPKEEEKKVYSALHALLSTLGTKPSTAPGATAAPGAFGGPVATAAQSSGPAYGSTQPPYSAPPGSASYPPSSGTFGAPVYATPQYTSTPQFPGSFSQPSYPSVDSYAQHPYRPPGTAWPPRP